MQTVEGHHGAQTEGLLKPYFVDSLGAAHPLYLNIYASIGKRKKMTEGACLCGLLTLQRNSFWSILMFKEKVILRYTKVPMYFCYGRFLLQKYI